MLFDYLKRKFGSAAEAAKRLFDIIKMVMLVFTILLIMLSYSWFSMVGSIVLMVCMYLMLNGLEECVLDDYRKRDKEITAEFTDED